MKKGFLKTLAAAAVAAAVVALGSVVAFAGTTTIKLDEASEITTVSTSTYFDLGGGVEANFAEVKDDDRSFNGVSYTAYGKLNAKNDKNFKSEDSVTSQNSIKYTGSKGDTIKIVIKGNNVTQYTMRCTETLSDGSNTLAEGTYTDVKILVDDKAKLAQFSYTLQDDGFVYIYAPKDNPTYNSVNVYIYQIDVVTADVITNTTTKTTSPGEMPAVITSSTSNYVVSVVPAANLASYSTLAQKTSAGESLASTDTVYESVTIGDAIYTAKDLGGAEGDYVYASIITNNSNTDEETVIADIQKLVDTYE